MNFLKTLLWVALIVLLVLFAINNWEPVSVKLWSGLLLDTKLPMLVIASFFAGLLPLLMWHKTTNWRLKRKIATLEDSAAYRKPFDVGSENTPPRTAKNEGSAI